MNIFNFTSGEYSTDEESEGDFKEFLKNLAQSVLTTAALGAAYAVGDLMAKHFQREMRDFLVAKNLPPEQAVKIVGDDVVVGSARIRESNNYSNYSRPEPRRVPSYSNYDHNRSHSQSDDLFDRWNS